ncbi:histidine kinase famiy protein [Roseateles sp. DC23W]|uniref:histidine kinase n=1 Tax=Pelomonas dachongensis TaxID=3299029 RepID=A0ABW7ETZ9_9BURK
MKNEKPELKGAPPRISEGIHGAKGMEHERDDMFFAAMQTTRMPMLVTDPHQPDNPIIFSNRAFLQMTGYEESEILGTNCRFLQGPGTDRATVAAVREAIDARHDITVEILNYRKDGSSFWNALYVSPVFNKAGELVYFFASQLDVSRRRDAETALHQAQKMEALGQLTGGIAHDFNNLLQVMSGQIDLMALKARMNKLDSAAAVVAAQKLRDAVGKAATLTSQLLSFSRKQRLVGRVININHLVEAFVPMVDRAIGTDIEIKRELAPDLWNCTLDPTQLEVALLNVVVNARDAMPGGGHVSIATSNSHIVENDGELTQLLQPGKYVTISVSDTGTGIPAHLLARVVDPFFTTKEEGKGTGLGLSMAFGFAKQSGGTLTLYSEEKVGTTVKMYFPAVPEAASREPVDLAPMYRGGTERILVVDDREEVAQLATEMLESLGYTVTLASDGKKALETVKRMPAAERPALLFSDVIMPGGMNGYVLARAMQELVPNIRVLLTTGYAGDLGGRIEPGITEEFDVLRKPFRFKELALRVRTVLDGATGATF